MSYGDSGNYLLTQIVFLTKTLIWFLHDRHLVERLARVNPTELSHNEKLAFWINIYNALIMHVITNVFSNFLCILQIYSLKIV